MGLNKFLKIGSCLVSREGPPLFCVLRDSTRERASFLVVRQKSGHTTKFFLKTRYLKNKTLELSYRVSAHKAGGFLTTLWLVVFHSQKTIHSCIHTYVQAFPIMFIPFVAVLSLGTFALTRKILSIESFHRSKQ